ncbi:hypothetical protein [Aureimonas glaciei]|uniref:DUF4440 domain-containing protein n=1 Tax=Aureimonas glaciei TaxID=1776957 RepID=A0A916XZB2_9HYPH|nr:hypothetical protein [Aureimonas glaciei]GGD22809.1 hypothetical protein GCM10011335_27140 [Aureimonas glaciei]
MTAADAHPGAAAPADLGALALAEVVACHAFFVDWYAGRLGEAALTDRLTAFSPDFLRIAPDGREVRFADLDGFLSARRAAKPDNFAIRIEDGHTVWQDDRAALVSYVEYQQTGALETRRRSTALFLACPTAPHGVLWRHLQETTIQPNGSAGKTPSAE